MRVNVEKKTDFSLMEEAMRFTSGKNVELTRGNIDWMFDAEHSPVRTQIYVVKMYDIPTYVSVHLTRHKLGVEHYVKSNRKTKEVVTRDTPVDHMMVLNAQALMTMCRSRLCQKADKTTNLVMTLIKEEMKGLDSVMATYMVPMCIYRGRCPEKYSCKK